MDSLRERICVEARSWIGTPYHHLQQAKGLGCDCIGLIVGISRNLGMLPHDFVPYAYSAEWHLHNAGELLRQGVADYGCTPVDAYAPGDILLFRFAHAASHSAIVMPENKIVHAVLNKRVREEPLTAAWLAILDSAWAFPEVKYA